MRYYVMQRLTPRQVRVIAWFWMKASAFFFVNSARPGVQTYFVHETADTFHPGEILNFPEV